MTYVISHDSPGLENGLTKFRDFPWLGNTLLDVGTANITALRHSRHQSVLAYLGERRRRDIMKYTNQEKIKRQKSWLSYSQFWKALVIYIAYSEAGLQRSQ